MYQVVSPVNSIRNYFHLGKSCHIGHLWSLLYHERRSTNIRPDLGALVRIIGPVLYSIFYHTDEVEILFLLSVHAAKKREKKCIFTTSLSYNITRDESE